MLLQVAIGSDIFLVDVLEYEEGFFIKIHNSFRLLSCADFWNTPNNKDSITGGGTWCNQEGGQKVKQRTPMPGYYRKNIVKNAQRKFLLRKKRKQEAKQAAGTQEMTETKEEK